MRLLRFPPFPSTYTPLPSSLFPFFVSNTLSSKQSMLVPATSDEFRLCHVSPPDIHVVTVGGHSIPAHSSVLASGSSVLENMISRQRMHILGAPYVAVLEFLRFIYAGEGGRAAEEIASAMNQHGVQLLALAHAYRVGWLKESCEAAVSKQVGPGDAIDVMKLARLCDAPQLHRHCLSVVAKNFAAVQRSDGWRFVRSHDPRLELEVLQFMVEVEQRRKRWRRERADQEVFLQLSEAMDCLQHICTEGCTVVGPHDGERPSLRMEPCTSFRTCEALQLLIRHFATCGKKLTGGGGCMHCKRMWQLFRLHSLLCDRESCKVPLCRKFKAKGAEEGGKGKGDEATWRLLVRKVVVAKVMASLAARKTPEQLMKAWEIYRKNN